MDDKLVLEKEFLGKDFKTKNNKKYSVENIIEIEGEIFFIVRFQDTTNRFTFKLKDIIENNLSLKASKEIVEGVKYRNKKGEVATVVEYISSTEVICLFSNKERIKTTIQALRLGLFSNPLTSSTRSIKNIKEFENKIFNSKNGLKYHMKEYFNARKILIEFEDGLRAYTDANRIRKNLVVHPKDSLHRDKSQELIGATFISKDMHRCICVEYKNSKNVFVEFEDGKNMKFNIFDLRKGNFVKENNRKTKNYYVENILGKCFINKVGKKVKVINYFNNRNVVCQFEDGVIKAFHLDKLNKGCFSHPDDSTSNKESMRKRNIGKIYKNYYNMKAVCIEYEGAKAVTCQFEDGEILTTSLGNFTKGKFSHPKINNLTNSSSYNVYKMLDLDGNIIYIGKTIQIDVRMFQHFSSHLEESGKEWYKNVREVYYSSYENSQQMSNAERYLIKKYKPIGNKYYYENSSIDYVEEESLKWEDFKINDFKIFQKNITKNY